MKPIDQSAIAAHNKSLLRHVHNDYEHLGEQLARRNVDIEVVRAQVVRFGVAIPSWGVGTGGTRFARFPGRGEPRHVFDKLQDCSVIQQLARATPTVSLHIPWDKCSDWGELREAAASAGLGFDAMNSNTFADQHGQAHSYKFGSLSHTDAATRAQAVEHNIECIEIGQKLGVPVAELVHAEERRSVAALHAEGSVATRPRRRRNDSRSACAKRSRSRPSNVSRPASPRTNSPNSAATSPYRPR